MADHGRLRVAVIFGGRSSEHSISCVSAGSVLAAIDRARYEPVLVGITREGAWVRVPDVPATLRIVEGVLPEVPQDGEPLSLLPDPVAMAHGQQAADRLLAGIDVAFPLLHGPFGEDGTIQGVLELAGIPYVGSGVFASAAAMDKGHMKASLAGAGLEVGPYELVSDRDWRERRDESLDRALALGFPSFVKPARAGSSMGISKVTDAAGLAPAIEAAREHDPRVIVEAGLAEVREIECGVIDGGAGPRASLCAEIVVGAGHDFYDFSAKYLEDVVQLIVPADLDAALLAGVQERAIMAFEALTCEGLARVDFFITADGRPVVNEVNTMPGFTPISMFPRMWQVTGVDYPQLIDHLIQDALRRGTGLR